MATYILKIGNSDLSGGSDFDKELSSGTESANSVTARTAGGSTETSYAYTVANVPNNNDWNTGTITVEVNITTANSNVELSMSASRLDSAGSVQETSSATAEQNCGSTGVLNFTIPSTNWSAGACGDRLRINYIFRETAGMSPQDVIIETGTTNTEHVTVIDEDVGACVFTPSAMFF